MNPFKLIMRLFKWEAYALHNLFAPLHEPQPTCKVILVHPWRPTDGFQAQCLCNTHNYYFCAYSAAPLPKVCPIEYKAKRKP